MPVVIACPHCHHTLSVHESSAGQVVTCPFCRQLLTAPTPTTVAEPVTDVTARRTRDRRAAGSALSITLLIAAVVVVGVAAAGGVYLYLSTQRRAAPVAEGASAESSAKPGLVRKDAQQGNQPLKKAVTADQSTKSKPSQLPAVEDRKWRAEVLLEYRDALLARERRLSEMAVRAGSLTEAERMHALRCAKQLDELGLDRVPSETADAAAKIAPRYVEALRREQFMQTPEYARLVAEGKMPARHPIAKRKELYAEFAAVTGEDPKWSPASLFEDLNATEMDALMEATAKLKKNGLAQLSKEQRLLVLKAGALDYFKNELDRQ